MTPGIKVKYDNEAGFCIIGTIDSEGIEGEHARWDFAYCRVRDDGYIEVNAAAGAVLDRTHAILFADRLRAMAEALPTPTPPDRAEGEGK